MEIKDLLSPADVMVDVDGSDKARLLKDLSTHAGSALKLKADTITAEISNREALGSTGIGGGVAIPHARISDLKKPFGILARLRKPIEFEAIDGQPVDLVFLLLLPAAREGEQLKALACVARKLRDPTAVREVRSAADSGTLYRAVVG
jgi:PTS system nitrogen regulatory IIA component